MLSAVPAAVVAFGSALCNDLAGFINIQGAFYGLLLSLLVAVYYSYATAWFVIAFALLTGVILATASMRAAPLLCALHSCVLLLSMRAAPILCALCSDLHELYLSCCADQFIICAGFQRGI